MNEATFCEMPRFFEVGEVFGEGRPGDVVLYIPLLSDAARLHFRSGGPIEPSPKICVVTPCRSSLIERPSAIRDASE